MSTNVGQIDLSLILNDSEYQKKFDNVMRKSDSTANQVQNSMKKTFSKIGGIVAAAFAVGKVIDFGKTCVSVATETSNAWIGLNSILTGQGKSFDNAKAYIENYISDGLVPLNNAVAAYKNLALRGYSSDQIQKTMEALKNSATFARQSTYTLGEAVQTATEGLKNENSVVVDNAGVTKNVAKMWEDYAKSIGKTTNNLTQQEKIQAEVNGILEETKFQSNDAAIYASTYSGKVAQLNTAFTMMKTAIGNVIQPIAKMFIPVITAATNAITRLFNGIAGLLAMFGLKADSVETVSKGIEGIGASADNTSDSIKGVGDSAKKTKKKVDKSLASFDTAQVLSSNKSDSSGSGSGGVSGSSVGAEIPDLTSGLSNQITGINDLFSKINLQPLLDSFKNLGEAIKYFGDGAKLILTDFYNNCLVPIGEYVITDALPHFFNSTADAIKSIDFEKINNALNELWKSLVPFAKNVGDGLLWFYDHVLIPIGTWVINDVVPAFLHILSGALDVVNKAIEDIKPIFEWFWDNCLSPIAEWTGGVIVDVLNGIGDALKWISGNEVAMAVLEGIAIAIGLVTGAIVAFNVAMGICNVVTGIFSGIMAVLTSPITLVVAAIGALIAIIILLVKNWDTVKEAAGKAWDFIKGVWEKVSGWFDEHVIQPVKEFFGNLWNGIKEFASNAWEAIKLIWILAAAWYYEKIIKPVLDFFTSMWNTIKNAAKTAWEGIKNVWNAVSSWFNTKIITPIKNAFSNMWNSLKTGASNVWKAIKSVFSSVGSFFGGIWNTIKSKFTNIGQKIGDAIGGAFKKAINSVLRTVENVVNTPIKAINGLLDVINKVPGINLGKLSTFNLPRLAQGGYVKANTPQLAVIGDNKHQGEYVTPEDKLSRLIRENSGGSNEEVASLLKTIIQLISNIDPNYNLYLDSYELLTRLEKANRKRKFAMNGG